MNVLKLVAFGWLVPGGAYLLMRRYLQFALFAATVFVAVVAGLALHGSFAWPGSADLAGLDNMTRLIFEAGACAKLLAGLPYLVVKALVGSGSFLEGRTHEYGSTLLAIAGLVNLLGIASALDLRNAKEKE